jgi:acyl carrier protein
MAFNKSLTPAEVLSKVTSLRQPRPVLENPSVPTRNDTEATLAGCWAEVLRLKEVGRDDNFFSLGGDSLHMTLIASRMRERYGIELPLHTFLEHPTVAEQAAILARVPSNEVEETKQTIGKNVWGILDTEVELTERSWSPLLTRTPAEKKPLQISAIVIPTCERPPALRRCLTALLRNLREYGHTPRIFIADGSRDLNAVQENEDAARQAREKYSGDINLLGIKQRQSLIHKMNQAGFDRDLLDFAFLGMDHLGLGSIGATRNMLLTATASETFLSLDDDTECSFAHAPLFRSHLQYSSCGSIFDRDPTEIWIKPNRQSLLASTSFTAVDFIGSHQELLGRDTAQIATALRSSGQASKEDLGQLNQKSDRILVTLNGLIGDCGWGTPSRYFFIGDSSFARLTESEESYRSGSTSREMLRVAPSFIISSNADNLMSTAFGADGRVLLPPFFPVGRGSDALFGQLLKHIIPSAVFGHLPWAILHQPLESRRFWLGEVLRSAKSTDLRGMMCDLLSAVPKKEFQTQKEATQHVGESLIEIAAQSLLNFRSQLVQQRRASLAQEVAALELRMEVSDPMPSAIYQDMRMYIQTLKEGSDLHTAGIPAELLYGRDLEDALSIARDLTALFGRLLCLWPDMIASKSRVQFL